MKSSPTPCTTHTMTPETTLEARSTHSYHTDPRNSDTRPTIVDPPATSIPDPKVLLDVGVEGTKTSTLKGNAVNIFLDYTLSEEGEGDNISGIKELRANGHNEDDTNSKRPKVPLTPTDTTK